LDLAKEKDQEKEKIYRIIFKICQKEPNLELFRQCENLCTLLAHGNSYLFSFIQNDPFFKKINKFYFTNRLAKIQRELTF